MTYTGFLQLEVGQKNNRTIVSDSFYDGVFKITRPTYLSEQLPLITLIHVGGGYVDGDRYHTELTVGRGARMALTTQASTKIYKSLRSGVMQTSNYYLNDDSHLFIKQDPLILYKQAKFIQLSNVFLTRSSVFYYTDVVTPGWSEDGIPFQYKKINAKMRIYVDGNLQVFDHLMLDTLSDLKSLMYLDGYTHIGTMIFIHRKVDEYFIANLREKLLIYSNKVRLGISLLSINGFTIKVLANSTPIIETVFSECENFIGEYLYQGRRIEWRKG
ncbi:urease accessory protein UreD [Caldibacillus thermoamylovorans]